ncbi:hypothetical protein HELRODRAFT_164936 [Helobdella robusta]|uniref:Uncharacterized protein n=1 Tax=Helobdella robusta TaxID=6412 RepID=T1EVZ7_HELRO|nr:hypothetical protein HELRODRAFT_164936 [Helobdella robusta]ESN92813.1 hypothetical protein HELRODRAFT_164936 [Helobdella robusta]
MKSNKPPGPVDEIKFLDDFSIEKSRDTAYYIRYETNENKQDRHEYERKHEENYEEMDPQLPTQSPMQNPIPQHHIKHKNYLHKAPLSLLPYSMPTSETYLYSNVQFKSTFRKHPKLLGVNFETLIFNIYTNNSTKIPTKKPNTQVSGRH